MVNLYYRPDVYCYEDDYEDERELEREALEKARRGQVFNGDLIVSRCGHLGLTEINLETLDLDPMRLSALDAELLGISIDGEGMTLRMLDGLHASLSYHAKERTVDWLDLDPEEEAPYVFRLISEILDEVETGGLFRLTPDGGVERRYLRGDGNDATVF